MINTIILHVSLPAVTLRHLHDFRFDGNELWPVLMPWALFLIGAALFDGLGLVLALSTLGIDAAALYAAEGPVSPRAMLRRVVTFPPFIALVAALLLMPFTFPSVLSQTLARIGDTLAPLALLSVGLQLRFDALREHRRLLCYGLGYKLRVCPALVVALLWLPGSGPDMVGRVSVIEAAMPPIIGAAVVASQANLGPRLVSMMVGLGIPIGLFTAPGWFWLFGAFGPA